MDHEAQQSDGADRLPDEIVERLRRTDRRVSIVEPRVDAALLEQARAHFAGRPARRRRTGATRPALRFAAAAAVAAVAFLLVRPAGFWGPAGGPDDIDASGRVDILDAFALARMRAAGRPVSQEEIDGLVGRIVALDSPRELP